MPNDAPPALTRMPSLPPIAPVAAETLLLHTRLLGDLRVQGSPDQAAELQALSARAAVYATRARGEGTRRAFTMYAVRCADRGLTVASLRVHLAAI
ncbi:hypothetical protein [Muricoccus aerilatus]|uniref:hypothetical protein n=1 Tax=Muricoccus aerilatus TaxID=452982 RepID=UPI0005C20C05|nr:hypothetical protein [Roseomonas aerilata]